MGTRITEKKRIDVDAACVDNPVFLNWQGTAGGERNYWLFSYNQSKNINTSVGDTFAPYVKNNTTARTYLEEITRGAFESLTVGAFAPVSKIDGIKTLLYSPNVLLLTNPDTWETDGAKWVRVFPEPGSFRVYDTQQEWAEIQLTLRFNEINIQSY